MPWDFIVILVVLGVLVPWRGAVRARVLLRQPTIAPEERRMIYVSTMVFQWVTTLVVAWRAWARGLPSEALGVLVPDPALAFGVAVLLCVVLGIAQLLGLRRMARLPRNRQGLLGAITRKLLPQNSGETLLFVGLAATAGVCEEFLYRGFALEIFRESVGGSEVFGALASSALFAFAHLYQGRRGMATTFVAGLVFAASRIGTGSIVPGIAGHFATDLLAGIAGPRLLGKAERDEVVDAISR